MSSDIHIKLETIDGDSLDEGHAGEIELLSASHGSSRNIGSYSSGGSATQEPPHLQDFVFTKTVDKASPKIQGALWNGTNIATAKLTIDKQDGQGGKVGYVTYEFEKVHISSYSVGASTGGGAPLETVSFAFAKITYLYSPTSTQTGAAEGQITAGWDLELNKPV